MCFSGVPSITSKFLSQNSAMTCRHTPHGLHSPETVFSGPPTIAIATKLRSPSLTALKKAVRSAQLSVNTRHFQYYIRYISYLTKQAARLLPGNENTEYMRFHVPWRQDSSMLRILSLLYLVPEGCSRCTLFVYAKNVKNSCSDICECRTCAEVNAGFDVFSVNQHRYAFTRMVG